MKIKQETIQRLIVKSATLEVWAAKRFAGSDSINALFLSNGIRSTLEQIFTKEWISELEKSLTPLFISAVMKELSLSFLEDEMNRVRTHETERCLTIMDMQRARTSMPVELREFLEALTGKSDN